MERKTCEMLRGRNENSTRLLSRPGKCTRFPVSKYCNPFRLLHLEGVGTASLLITQTLQVAA